MWIFKEEITMKRPLNGFHVCNVIITIVVSLLVALPASAQQVRLAPPQVTPTLPGPILVTPNLGSPGGFSVKPLPPLPTPTLTPAPRPALIQSRPIVLYEPAPGQIKTITVPPPPPKEILHTPEAHAHYCEDKCRSRQYCAGEPVCFTACVRGCESQ